MSFAEGTSVPVEKTRGEIESLLRKYGASQFSSGWTQHEAGLTFIVSDRRVQFKVPMMKAEDIKQPSRGRRRNVSEAVMAEERRRWRCLMLAIKAKLEAVETGISTFEEEFLAHIVTDNGRTVWERISTDRAMSSRMLPAIGESAP